MCSLTSSRFSTVFLVSFILCSSAVPATDEYQRRFCGKTCRGETVKSLSELACSDVQCFDCMCQMPTCEIYGICCPSDENNGMQGGNHTMGTTHTLSGPTLMCEASDSGYYLYIQSCPAHFSGPQTRKLCENDLDPLEDTTLDQFARATDVGTKVTYRNTHCALCNGVPKPVQWNVSVTCVHFLYVYGATSFDQLLTLSLRPDSACHVRQEPLVKHLVPCTPRWFSNEVISSCNQTGAWRQRDDDVERACLQMQRRSFGLYFKKQRSPQRVYRNIFCAICNLAAYPSCRSNGLFPPLIAQISSSVPHSSLPDLELEDPTLVLKPLERQLPFKLILGFRRTRSRAIYESAFNFSSCQSGTWPSPDGQCLKLHCSPGKLSQNGTCVTALAQIRGLSYQFSLWFERSRKDLETNITSQSLNQLSAEAYRHFEDKVVSHLNGTLDGFEITVTAISAARQAKEAGGLAAHHVTLCLQVLVVASREISRDRFEMKLATFVDHLSGNPHLGYTPLVVLGETDSSSFCSDPGVRCHKSEGSDYAAIWPSSFTARDHFINAGQNLSCECVQFNSSDYEIEKTDRTTSFIPVLKLSLTLGKITLVFTEWTELSSMSVDRAGILRVCRESLDSKLRRFEKDRLREFIAKTHDQSGFSAVEKAQYALTLVCVGVSMVCLALTLLTYLSFRALRNEAGLNNTFLCASLLMAQAFLVASSHVSGPGPVCTALGLVTHFLWLWLFAWSWLCCLHMYRVFSLTTGGHHIRTHRRGCCSWLDSRLVRTVALSLTLPVGVVCAVTVASLGASGGSRTGYGRDACYLDTPLLVGLGTVLPLCAVIASNAVFFTITACKIRHTRALQSRDFSRSKQSERTDLFIYIKLSSITGVFWLVQIMAEALDNDVLRFLAIVTNGLQGVFIFLSYTCNTRVLGLYRRGLGVRDTTLTSLDSQKKATGQDIKQSSISVSSTERFANNSSVNTDC